MKAGVAPQKQQEADWCDVNWLPKRNELIVGSCPKPPAAFFRVRDNFGLSDPIRVLCRRCVNAPTTDPPEHSRLYSTAETVNYYILLCFHMISTAVLLVIKQHGRSAVNLFYILYDEIKIKPHIFLILYFFNF